MPIGVYTRPERLKRPVRPIQFVIGPSIAYVPLSRGLFALIEVDDAHLVWGKNWCTAGRRKEDLRYAIHRQRKTLKTEHMHRVIMGEPHGLNVDHANRNGLDNRRHGNLRRASHSQNLANSRRRANNTTGFKGVSLTGNRHRNKYRANIAWEGKQYFLGHYPTAELAHSAVCAKAKELHGEFARFR